MAVIGHLESDSWSSQSYKVHSAISTNHRIDHNNHSNNYLSKEKQGNVCGEGIHSAASFLVPLLTLKMNYYHMLNICTRLYYFGPYTWKTFEECSRRKSRLKHIQRLVILYYISLCFSFLYFKDTPLLEAARNGHTDIVRLLIENGANVYIEGGVR